MNLLQCVDDRVYHCVRMKVANSVLHGPTHNVNTYNNVFIPTWDSIEITVLARSWDRVRKEMQR